MSEALPRSGAKPGVPPLLIAGLVSFGTLFETMNSTGLAVALNTIAGDLASSPEESDTVLTAYLIANAAILPISGWASVYFGRKKYYITCVALFTIASALCAMAWSLESLIFFRILQGMAAAGNAASETSLIADTMPPEKRGLGFALYGMAVVIGPTIGPIYGGWVAENYSWSWIFWINVPTGIAAVVACSLLLRDPPAVEKQTREKRARGVRADWFGFAMAALGLATLSYVLDRGQSNDWFGSSRILVAAIVSSLCLLILPIRELTARDPVLDVRMFADRNFTGSWLLLFVTGAVLFSAPAVFPLLTQQGFGYTATWAGFANGLGGLSVLFVIPLVGLLTGKVATRHLVGFGLAVSAVGLFMSTRIYPDVSFMQVALFNVGQSIGIAFIISPLQSQSFVGVPNGRSEQVGAFNSMAINVGGSVGTALSITLLERGRQTYREQLVPYASPYRDEYRQALQDYGSVGAFDAVLNGQASILAFQHVFFALACVIVVSLPLVLLLRGKPGEEEQQQG